jgi:hypothetical protein
MYCTRLVLSIAAIVFGASTLSACGSSSRPTSASAITTVPNTSVPAATSSADLCNRFVETLLSAGREHWNDGQTEAAYRALAAAGRAADAHTTTMIGNVAETMSTSTATSMSLHVSNATAAVIARCKRLGHPVTQAQKDELRQLLLQAFSPSTTVAP